MSSAASEIEGIVWPPLADAASRPLPALLSQFEHWEQRPMSDLAAGQSAQLTALVSHAAQASPHFRERLRQAGLASQGEWDLARLMRLPPLTRRALQAAGGAAHCDPVPASHLPMGETRTSGSSGEPVVVRRTAVNQLFWLACTMREHLWWRRDLSGTLAIVRANLPQERVSQADWGPPASLLARTGPAHAFSMSLDTASLAKRLQAVDPHYLLIYPNQLADLLRWGARQTLRLPRLREIRSVGETLSDALRAQTRRQLGVEIVDSYSSQEVGVIAIQCPVGGGYHVMAESLLVEVLHADGRPCVPGETGEVVITDLHNFATPLVRYAIGDYAEVGGPCICGRSLPVLRRIVGRSRNMVRYPDGARRWPRVGFDRFRDVAPVVQYQLVQRSLEFIEVRLVAERPLTLGEERALADIIRSALGHAYVLAFAYFSDRVPRGSGGKFEEFVCEVEGD